MKNAMLRLCGTLFCCLLAAPGWALNVPASPVRMDGQELARALNQRLASTPVRCLDGQPDYACSGVLVRPMAEKHLTQFWLHDAEAITHGGERFDYLRQDVSLAPDDQRTGYVMMSSFAAAAAGRPYSVKARPGPAEVLVSNWDHARPLTAAIEALYYTVAKPKALLRAQRGQLAWFRATGQWLPVLRFEPGNVAGAFGYDTRDQLYYGYEVMERVTGRYGDTSATCPDGSAAFNCNGVLLRTTDVGNFHAWDPSPNSLARNGVSFSFLRTDTRVSTTYKVQGFIVRPQAYPVTQPMALRCVYPHDAHTGALADMCTSRPSCASLNITTAQAWKSNYQGNSISSCYFSPNPVEFQLSNAIRGAGGFSPDYGWNELMMAAWRPGTGAGLPLEAFIYGGVTARPGQGLPGAQAFQLDYYQTTQRYLPILRVQPGAPVAQVFSYNPDDQQVD
ncbi:hypothetical protein [Pseudomonas sp.]|uniref:hypothetical protein n=1 Tax=Pseudomonas sp. TaxID=306 RepID=UPI003D6E7A8A